MLYFEDSLELVSPIDAPAVFGRYRFGLPTAKLMRIFCFLDDLNDFRLFGTLWLKNLDGRILSGVPTTDAVSFIGYIIASLGRIRSGVPTMDLQLLFLLCLLI